LDSQALNHQRNIDDKSFVSFNNQQSNNQHSKKQSDHKQSHGSGGKNM
jgi:stress response protein SCP2